MQPGFFSAEEVERKTRLHFKFDEGPNCHKCGLHLKCNSPKMQYTGEGEKRVLIIAEAPGKNEDLQGMQLVGDAGQLLRTELYNIGMDLDQDFWKTNALSCRPATKTGANRAPTRTELKHCKPLVDKTITDLNPDMIWLFGNKALESVYMERFSGLAISRWRKLCIPDRKTGKWIIPLFHPSYIMRNSYDKNLQATFRRDLKWAVSCIGKEPHTFSDERNDVVCLYDFKEICQHLNQVLTTAEGAFTPFYIDYETNALKPQWPGSKVATVSYCMDPAGTAIAFPYQYANFFDRKQQTHIKSLWRRILKHKNIGVIAHNAKFEDAWTKQIFGVVPRTWLFDTQIAAHIEDNRSQYTGLKFQSYIKFGLEPYNKGVNVYLKSKKGHFNTVDQAPLDELLLYNGLDTKMGMQLYQEQQKMFTLTSKLYPKNDFSSAYKMFHEGTLAFSDMQRNGICIDEDYYKTQNQKIEAETNALRDSLKDSPEAKQFKKKKNKELDVGSTKDLGILFYDILKLPAQLTDKNNYKVDVAALEAIDLPFVADLLRLRKLEKVKGTYFAQLLREVCGGKVYPFYSLNIPRSYRSSSQAPNWQNQPAHDAEAGKMVRAGIFPTKGNKISEIDYSSIEVRVAAMYTQDPVLLEEVTVDDADMHRDTAIDVWRLPAEEITKEVRFHSKAWNFGSFYGASYKSSADILWKQISTKIKSGLTLKEHLRLIGITSFHAFEAHCKEYYNEFWNERFVVYSQWKEDINKLYRKQGYVENKFGFRFSSHMNEREVTNYPIQSTAFIILLDSLIRINQIAKAEKWQTKIVGQIHDSILLDIHPDEENHVLQTCMYEMSDHSQELHDWIDVPIPVEVELTETDEAWYYKREVKM
jgi:uracil-DNA glycosylase family 4